MLDQCSWISWVHSSRELRFNKAMNCPVLKCNKSINDKTTFPRTNKISTIQEYWPPQIRMISQYMPHHQSRLFMAFLWHHLWLKSWINDKQDIIVCNLIRE